MIALRFLIFLLYLLCFESKKVIPLKQSGNHLQRSINQINQLQKIQAILLDKEEYSYINNNNNDDYELILVSLQKQQNRNPILIQNLRGKMSKNKFASDSERTLTVNMNNLLNTQYIGEISIGSPENIFKSIYDTGLIILFL